MKKKFKKLLFFLIFAVLSVSCSNNTMKIEHSIAKQSLVAFVEGLRQDIKYRDLESFKFKMVSSSNNEKIYEELRDLDFSEVSIFISEPEYSSGTGKSVLAINFQDTTEYYNILYLLDKNNWKIKTFEEK